MKMMSERYHTAHVSGLGPEASFMLRYIRVPFGRVFKKLFFSPPSLR